MTPAPAEEPEVQEESAEPMAPDYGPRNERLPEQLIRVLRASIVEFQKQEEYLRRREVLHDRRNRFYEAGQQQLYWRGGANGQGSFAAVSPGGVITNSSGQSVQAPNFCDSYNIFHPYERILQSILTQNPPGIDFQPEDPNRTEDTEAAEAAECYRKYFNRANDIKEIQTKIVRMMCLSGRVVTWTRTVANAQRWGENEQGQPKQMETTEVFGTLESKVPILAKALESALYCFLYKDPDVKQAKSEYPEAAEKIKGGGAAPGENEYERWARLGVLQGSKLENQTGHAFDHITTEAHCFMRPEAFVGQNFEQPFEEDEFVTIREKLLELFPKGVRVVFEGDAYCASFADCMDDGLTIKFPYEGDGLFRMAIMDPFVVVQDSFNDDMNTAREVWDFGWPATWVNADEAEYDAITSQRADPYAYRQIKELAAGMKAEEKFYREPDPVLPESFLQFMETLQGPLAQFMLATPPALFGAAMEDQKTASGYAQARVQAMGQLGLIWQSIQWVWARIYFQAAICATNNPDHAKEIAIPGDDGQVTSIRMDRLDPQRGKFGAYPDEDSGFPETTQAKRATLDMVMTQLTAVQSPVAVQIFASPDNVAEYLRQHGLNELVIPEALAREKQLFEIEELLKGAPMQPDPEAVMQAQQEHATVAVQQGPDAPAPPFMPPPPKSSVPVNPWDYHEWEAKKCQDWLSSSACRRQLALRTDEMPNGNVLGVQNVALHWQEHVEAMAAQMMAAQAAMAPQQQPGAEAGPPKPAAAPKPAPKQLAKPGAPPPNAPAVAPPAQSAPMAI